MKKWLNLLRRHKILVSICIVLLVASLTIPLPYYIFQPGSAEPLQPIVTVQGGHKDEKGSLMLTTVLTTPVSNVYYWIYGKLAPHAEFMTKQQVDGGIPTEGYTKVLEYMMNNSQTSAVIAAMRYLGKPVQVTYDGVEVANFTPGSLAAQKLRIGDIIVAANGVQVKTLEDLIRVLQTKRPGEVVTISAMRDKKPIEVSVPVITLPAAGNQPARVGLGFSPLQLQSANVPQKIDFNADGIGGPSAGMMFSLEIIAQLTPGDLTNGHRIAGTGTISDDGSVGQIGGIEHKIIAATNAHADIFFLPKDINSYDTNEKTAFEEAAKIHSPMKLVPIAKLSDAVAYLKTIQ